MFTRHILAGSSDSARSRTVRAEPTFGGAACTNLSQKEAGDWIALEHRGRDEPSGSTL